MTQPEPHLFHDDGRFPNSRLPLLLYRDALTADPAAMQRAFAANDWSNGWRNGILPYHHFHSIAHEVLGIAAGTATVAFGGPAGRSLAVHPGDVIVIPAGVAHCCLGSAPDFLVIGAYPGGGDWNVLRGDPAEHEEACRAIAAVPIPDHDPLSGSGGALLRLWAMD